jgi:prepilin-type processing-associated H-X9-DG protein
MKKKILIICSVIFILGFIFCITLFLSQKREEARRMSCAGNLVSLGCVLRMYSNVYDGHFPPSDGATGLDLLRSEGFCENVYVYTCPSTNDFLEKDKPLKDPGTSFMYFGGYTENDPPDTIVMCDKSKNHNGYINILFLDGMVGGYSNGVLFRYTKWKQIYTKSNRVISEEELKKIK